MSKKLDDHIDKLFKDTFSGQLTEGKDSTWLELNKKLRRKNFMQFGYKHFNIYYSLLIGALLVGTLLIVFKPDKKIESPEIQMNETILEKTDSQRIFEIKSLDTDTLDITDKNKSKPNLRKRRSLKNKNKKSNQFKQDSTQVINKNLTDTSVTSQDTVQTDKGVVVVKPIKKKIIIVQPEVIKKDTVITYEKKWWRWIKRKK